MVSEAKSARVLYEKLDTSFVNLWALLRYLSQRSFLGRVHVELENYSADVFLNGSDTPLVHEVDRETGTDVVEEAALHRLVLRVRESAGSITVYEGAEEATPPQIASSRPSQSPAETASIEPAAATPEAMRSSSAKNDDQDTPDAETETFVRPANEAEWGETVRVTGELIAGIERAATSLGGDFGELFRDARVSLADDYPFLDPMAGQMRYENSALSMNGELQPPGYVAGISEVLRRVIDSLAQGDRERRTRERIALELARVARKNTEALTRAGFDEHLDRIAGTKVI